jgi:hypothetical protein
LNEIQDEYTSTEILLLQKEALVIANKSNKNARRALIIGIIALILVIGLIIYSIILPIILRIGSINTSLSVF